MEVLEAVEISQEVEAHYECFYDFLDMVSFEISKYFRPYLPFQNSEGVLLDDPAVLTRDVYNISDQFFKIKCHMDAKKINYDHFATFFVNSYKDHLTKSDGSKGLSSAEAKIMEEDLMDVITDTSRKEIYS